MSRKFYRHGCDFLQGSLVPCIMTFDIPLTRSVSALVRSAVRPGEVLGIQEVLPPGALSGHAAGAADGAEELPATGGLPRPAGQ